ncbi:hypothetical protein HOC32_04045 [Candidatus Woesearchaeota archaeon]|nr:hypothetical protein [Candidatus Woesearchaeota archaeon]
MGIVRYLIIGVIAVSVIIVISGGLYGPEDGVLAKVVGFFGGVRDSIPDVVGGDELEGEIADVPQGHRAAIMRLNDTIYEMLDSDKQNCFASYGGFPNLNEGGGTSISLSSSSQGTAVSVTGGAGGRLVVADLRFEIEGMSPCVIAGSESVMDNFEDIFLEEDSWADKERRLQSNQNHYTPVGSLTITSDDDTNKLVVSSLGVNSNFEDAGLLYKVDDRYICFFPTVRGDADCDASKSDGIDDDCLGRSEGESESLTEQYRGGGIQQC